MLSIKDIRKARKILQTNELPANKVTSHQQATQMTLNDPTGHIWSIGETYYSLDGANIEHNQINPEDEGAF